MLVEDTYRSSLGINSSSMRSLYVEVDDKESIQYRASGDMSGDFPWE